MSSTQQKDINKALEELISQAVKKINGSKENDICRYLPSSTGGYIHHFTMRKMKHEDPVELTKMISKYIINASKPASVPPKQRAPRGTRKRRDQFMFSKVDIERMLHMARMANDKEMIRRLTPKRDLKTLKRELISSIRREEIELGLWEAFVDTIRVQNESETVNA